LRREAIIQEARRKIEATIGDQARSVASQLVSLVNNPAPEAYQVLSMWVKPGGLSHDERRQNRVPARPQPPGDAVIEGRRIAHSFYASPYDALYLKEASPLWQLLGDGEYRAAKD
jgi:hypothetical protein